MWVIVGCGYTGTALAKELVARGEDVTVTRRDTARIPTGLAVRRVACDLTTDAPPEGDVVVCLTPAGDTSKLRGGRVIYVSSTGVYAPGGGAVVDETFPTLPTTTSGHARLAAESRLPTSSVILRAAGIHGPGRGIADRIRAGTYRIVGDGRAHVSRIHVADLVAAILAAATRGEGIYNAADDDPSPIGVVADAFAARLGVPPPPRTPPETVDAEIRGMLTADRRISNARLKADLVPALRYPSWRTVLAELPATPAH